MKEDMGVADEMALLVLGSRMRSLRVAREARLNALICSLWWLEVMDCSENRHEGGYGHCRQNGVVGFGIARARSAPECTYLQFMVPRSDGLQ